MASPAHTTTAFETPAILGDRLSTLTFQQLEGALDAFIAAEEAIQGFFNQPRMSNGPYNTPAQNILEEEMTRLGFICGEIEEEAKRRVAKNTDEAEHKAHIIVRWGLRVGEGWKEIAEAAIAALDRRPIN